MRVNYKTGLKKCSGKTGCGRSFQVESFYKDRTSADGFARICIPCSKLRGAHYRAGKEDSAARYAREYRKTERGREADARKRFAKYGITAEIYQETLSLQGGRCAICRTDNPPIINTTETFVVDHDHASTLFRGVLCSPCNLLIGLANYDPAVLNAAVDYLVAFATKTHNARQVIDRIKEKESQSESESLREIEQAILNGESGQCPDKVTSRNKFCPKCKSTKPKSDFAICRSQPDGRYYSCRLCRATRDREYRLSKNKTRKS